jgi:uncharacterized protein YqjF (DUF2071 family)
MDTWNGICYLSLVGFMFINTRLKGFTIPFHADFEEVNLRFYVRHQEAGKWKRGVVFIKEYVPKPALTLIANIIYGEHYETLPMSHTLHTTIDELTVEYKWKKRRWNSLKIISDSNPGLIRDGSEEEFITEHYWGYTRISADRTSEYGVEHPKWEVYQTRDYFIDADFGHLYGKEFHFLTSEKPKSVFLAEGSEIKVRHRKPI